MFMADQIGVQRIADRLDQLAKERGDSFGYWEPSLLLRNLVKKRIA